MNNIEKDEQACNKTDAGASESISAKKNVYMICVLLCLATVAVASFFIDQKMKAQHENEAEEISMQYDNNSLTVYGEMSKAELLENLKPSVVQIEVKVPDSSNGDTTILGSGVILDITDTYIDIATASHVVELTAKPLVYFYDGSLAYGSVLAYGKLSDVAFVRVEAEALAEGIGEQLISVKCAESADYSALEADDIAFMLGSATKVATDVKEGLIREKEQFIELFQNHMLVCETPVSAGMSGGGTFDEAGKLIGIIVGTDGNNTVSVAVVDVMSEYRSISE